MCIEHSRIIRSKQVGASVRRHALRRCCFLDRLRGVVPLFHCCAPKAAALHLFVRHASFPSLRSACHHAVTPHTSSDTQNNRSATAQQQADASAAAWAHPHLNDACRASGCSDATLICRACISLRTLLSPRLSFVPKSLPSPPAPPPPRCCSRLRSAPPLCSLFVALLHSKMSNSKQADVEGSVASRTRTQTRMRDEEDEEEQRAAPSSAQPSSHVSPAMRIYRHALESIFAMLSLGDLAQVLAVSRAWLAAVRSMKPISAAIGDKNRFREWPPIARLVVSPLLRHLAAVHLTHARLSYTPLNNAALGLLAQHAHNLTSLCSALTLQPSKPLILPAKLTSLELRLDGDPTDTKINGALTALAALPSLSRLRLDLAAFEHANSVKLRLLASCPSLTDLMLRTAGRSAPTLTSAQVDQVRSFLGHLQRLDVGQMTPGFLSPLLQLPVTARWREIGQVNGGHYVGDLLLRLPSLTKLDVRYSHHTTAHADFLPRLSRLTSLILNCRDLATWRIPADTLLASLERCTCLTELDLSCGFNSAHWTALFAKLTIKKLALRYPWELKTLACFAAGPITQSLEDLTLEGVALLQSKLSHLYGLGRLRALRLVCAWSSRLDASTLASLIPPTPLLPALTLLSCQWRMIEGPQEHRGPSFEWMQQRVMQ